MPSLQKMLKMSIQTKKTEPIYYAGARDFCIMYLHTQVLNKFSFQTTCAGYFKVRMVRVWVVKWFCSTF